jgi:hypothetical protein
VLAYDSNLLCACFETPVVNHLSHLEVGTLLLVVDVCVDVDDVLMC